MPNLSDARSNTKNKYPWRKIEKAIRTLALMILTSVITFTVAASGGFCFEQEEGYFIRVSGGYSKPGLKNLSDELAVQGSEELKSGYGISVSLGHSVFSENWLVEANFSASFYRSFHYLNDYDQDNEYDEDFEGNLSHQHYALIVRRVLMPGNERFTPFIGLGAGYGVTNLISGGGKLGAFEWQVLGGFETRIKTNFSLLLEADYRAAFTTDTFDSPHLENVEGDAVYDSNGALLEDRFSSLEFRIGIVIKQSITER
jgi:opacity protein-like surface antigen